MGADNAFTSCDLRILAEEAAKPIASSNADAVVSRRNVGPAVGRALAEGPVRPVGVVVIDIFAEDVVQMSAAGDEDAVGALAPRAGDPPLSAHHRHALTRCARYPATPAATNTRSAPPSHPTPSSPSADTGTPRQPTAPLSAQIRSPRTKKPQVSALRSPPDHNREPTQDTRPEPITGPYLTMSAPNRVIGACVTGLIVL